MTKLIEQLKTYSLKNNDVMFKFLLDYDKQVADAQYHFFFFSSRRRHTRFDCDWSSDVCSSDLPGRGRLGPRLRRLPRRDRHRRRQPPPLLRRQRLLRPHHPLRPPPRPVAQHLRSEERRVGKECRSRWSRHE